MYQNFVNFTNIIKSKADLIMCEFQFHMRLPEYYKPNPDDVEQLRIIVNQKKSNPQGLEKATAQLRNGMNRNQYQTIAQQPKDEFFAEDDNKFNEQDDSDSGESFDYGDEAGDDYGDAKIDLIEYISQMPIDHLK